MVFLKIFSADPEKTTSPKVVSEKLRCADPCQPGSVCLSGIDVHIAFSPGFKKGIIGIWQLSTKIFDLSSRDS